MFIAKVAGQRGTPHIVKIAIDYSKRVQNAKNRFIDEFFKRQKILLIEPTVVLTALLGSSIATIIMNNILPRNFKHYPDKKKYAQIIIFFSGFWFIIESISNFIQLVQYDCTSVFYPGGEEW